MMHLGSYDNEPESLKLMQEFAEKENLFRISKVHREIYLSDPRRIAPEKLKTTLRFKVTSKLSAGHLPDNGWTLGTAGQN